MKEFLKSGKMIVSAVLALLGAIAATIAIVQFTETKPSETWILKRDGAPIDISASSGALRDVYQADIVNVLGTVSVEKDIAIIANEIVFKNGASLKAPGVNVTLIATRIRGGAVDASGAATEQEGGAGYAGGSIYAVAALFNGGEFVSTGGVGVRGAAGAAGADGVELSCGGELGVLTNRVFGNDERPLNVGQDGGEGAPGGAGGKGGVVKVYGHPGLVTATANVVGGAGGPGGNGGPGGKGAPGCGNLVVGDNGEAGPNGPDGPKGEKGLAEVLNFDFRSAGPYLKRKLKSVPPSAAAARQIAELAAAAGLAE